MASRFWVGGTGTWDASDTSHWASSSGGGSGASVPGTSDSATFDGSSGGGTVTVGYNPSVTSITSGAHTGTINFTGRTVTTSAAFSTTGTGTRTVNLTNATVTCATWTATTTTNLTFTSTGSTITCTGDNNTFNGGALTYNNVTLSPVATGPVAIAGVNSYANLTLNGFATKVLSYFLSADQTITGTLTINSNSSINRTRVMSNATGTARTLSAGTLVCTNVIIFRDITGAGAATWTTGASGASLFGDALGNSGITFTTSAQQTWSGTSGGNWSANAWTSRVPLPQDDVVIASAFSASQTITCDMSDLGRSITWAGSTGSPTWSFGSTANFIYGGLTLISGMSISGTQTTSFLGRSAFSITSATRTFTQAINLGSGNINGTDYTLADNFITNGALSMTGSTTTVTASANVTCQTFANAGTSVLNMGNGTWTLTNASGTIWSGSGGFAAVYPGNSTIVISGASTSTRTFAGAGRTYNNLTYNVATSPGSLTITGANTFNTITAGPTNLITFPSGSTTTVSAFAVTGSALGYQYLAGVASNYASAPDSAPLSITGDIDIRLRVAMDDWTPSSDNYLISKSVTSGNNLSWTFMMASNSRLRFYVSASGSAYFGNATASTALTGATDGTALWVRVTWRASDGRTQFFQADGTLSNPVAGDFTQVGTDQTLNAVSIFNSTAPVEVGSSNAGAVFAAGKFYRAQIRSGLDGTVQFDANFTAKTLMADSFTESSANAATVTITGAVAKLGDGRVGMVSSTPGSAATIAVPANTKLEVTSASIQDLTGPGLTKMFAYTSTNVSGNSGISFVDLTLTSADTGSGADAGSISVSSADTGSGADDNSTTASATSADTGTGTEDSQLGVGSDDAGTGTEDGRVGVSLADTGSGVEDASIGVSSAETGSGADASTTSAALSIADTGSGVDDASVSASLTVADTGSGVDDVSVSASLTVADTGVGTDDAAIAAFVSALDSASGVDAFLLLVTSADAGSGNDGTSLTVALTAADTGLGTDAFSVVVGEAHEVCWHAEMDGTTWWAALDVGRWEAELEPC